MTPDARPPRLAVVASHAIQYFCPQYAAWAALGRWEQRVFFASRAGLEAYHDVGFGHTVQWEGGGLKLDRFDHTFLNGDAVAPVTPALDAPALDAALDAFAPQAVLVYGYGQRIARRALAWARRAGARTLNLSDSNARAPSGLARELAKRVVVPRFYASVDAFLTVGDANEAYLRNYGARDARFFRSPFPLVRDPFDAGFAAREALRAPTRASLGFAEGDVVVACVGKFIARKRQRDLIDAVARQGPHVRLLLVGAGEDEAALRARAEAVAPGRVHFTGFVAPADLPPFFAAADIYAHVATDEPYGIAVAEAAYMGLPLVVSDRCGCCGPTSDAQPGRNALVVPAGALPPLSRALERLAAHPDLRARFGVASREIAVANQDLAYEGGVTHALVALGLLTGGPPGPSLA